MSILIKKKVLILCPLQSRRGGVSNYYNVLKDDLVPSDIEIAYYYTGKRSHAPNWISRAAYSFKDTIFLLLKFNKYDVIHLNPTLDPKGIVRDGFYHILAKNIFRKKTIVFFRGWNRKTEIIISKRFSKYIKKIFNFDYSIVLANEFKKTLISWGYKGKDIKVETTTVDKLLLKGFSIQDRIEKIDNLKTIQILYLARIEKEKGIIETIDAFKELSERYNNLKLVIAGGGPFEEQAKQYVNRISLKGVSFIGYVRDSIKKNVYFCSDIYVLPTYYKEGMPNSVLEAMAMGLPVVTTPVGGLKDFFKNGEHGFLVQKKDSKEIATSLERIMTDKKKWRTMAKSSHDFAVERFLSPKVAQRLEDTYRKVISS